MGKHVGIKLDTTGCGWCIADDEFNILESHKKTLIGVHTFPKADIAESRRLARSAKRRKEKEKERINFLNSVFKKHLEDNYIDALSEKGLLKEDRDYNWSDNELGLNKYPTIYHAKKALMDGTETDIRILYLALHHYMTNRGNFNTRKGNSVNDVKNFANVFAVFRKESAKLGIEFKVEPKKINEVSQILLAKLNSKEKVEKIADTLSVDKKDKVAIAAIQLFVGLTCDLKVFFAERFEDAEKGDSKVKFSDNVEWEEIRNGIEAFLGVEELAFVDAARAIFDWVIIKKMLGNERTFTESHVYSYDLHRADLMELKTLVKEMKPFNKGIFGRCFCDKNRSDNYCAYVKKSYNQKTNMRISCERDDFYAYLKREFEVVQNNTDKFDEKIKEIVDRMENGSYMPKQRNKDNNYIPNIFLCDELKMILTNAERVHPFLSEIGISGKLSVKDEIISIFSFVIPYWVGPVDDAKFGWCVRKSEGTLYPWNMTDILDLAATRKNFIKNITNDCEYITYEKVLPSNSYYVSKANVLNELNTIRIDGEPLSIKAKQGIFDDLFMNYERVSQKNVFCYLNEKGYLDNSVEHSVTGFTKKKLNHNMTSFVKAKAVYKDLTIEDYEKLAVAKTVCQTDRELMFSICEQDVKLDRDVINALLSVINVSSTNAWSTYSMTFLTEIKGKSDEEEPRNVVDMLYYTNKRMVDLMGSNFTYVEEIGRYNAKKAGNFTLNSFIESLNTPPYVKRSFFRLAAVLKDIRHSIGKVDTISINMYVPNNIMIRKVNERAKLTKALTALGETDLLKKLKNEDFLTKKKMLWYQQLGADIYTGTIIPYDELGSDKWTIDHIYPKSKVYDETLSNLVLCEKDVNKGKDNLFPVDLEIQENRKDVWKFLLDNNLITQKKFDALTCETGIPLDMALASIDKLLIEHRKTALLGTSIIVEQIMPNTKIIFVGDERLNDFKKKFNIISDCTINDKQYASDAYYSMIVGRVWKSIFTSNPKQYILNNPKYSLNVYNYDSKYWKVDESPVMDLNKVKVLFTKAQTSNITGAFSDETIYSAKHMQGLRCETIPKGNPKAKDADSLKYGGRKSVNTAYYAVVSYEKKKERVTVLVPIYTYMVNELSDYEKLQAYLEKRYKNPKIIRSKVLLYSIFEIDGLKYQIRSVSSSGAMQFSTAEFFTIDLEERYFKVFKASEMQGAYFESFVKKQNITDSELIDLYNNFVEKYQKHFYARKNNAVNVLISGRKKFEKLSTREKCIQLTRCFGLSRSNAKSVADLSLIGGKNTMGFFSLSSFPEGTKLLHLSPTGLFDKVEKLC